MIVILKKEKYAFSLIRFKKNKLLLLLLLILLEVYWGMEFQMKSRKGLSKIPLATGLRL